MNAYLKKHAFTAPIFECPPFAPTLIVCIPALQESALPITLQSLQKSKESFEKNILILVLFNHSEMATTAIKEANKSDFFAFAQAKETIESSSFALQAQLIELPKKHAGVGLARKILMDEAVRIFDSFEKEDGLLVTMDGDSTVAPNYFQAIHNFFLQNPKLEAASIHFEHPIPNEEAERNAIIQYELHLRYFIEAQRMAGLPTAFQTIGSSMAIRQVAYQKEGGMNKRKAGEDFYFLQKFARKRTLGDLRQTTVYPSSRISDRVPFGTGRAMGMMLDGNPNLTTHQLIIFDEVKLFIDSIPELWNLSEMETRKYLHQYPKAIQEFLSANDFITRVLDTQKHTSTQAAFVKRFFTWFDGFLMMKYVHFARDQFYPDGNVIAIAFQFAAREWDYAGAKSDTFALLKKYRSH